MSDRDDRLDSLLRQGPPEESGYVPPPISAIRPGPVARTAHDGRAAAHRSRAAILGWVALAAAVAAISVVGATLLATSVSRPPVAAGSPPAATAPAPTASNALPSASAQPQESAGAIQPFPSVAPDASTTPGTLLPGQVAVIADDHGPMLLVRVRGVQQLASVPGLTPASDGDLFLDVTVDVDVLRDVSQVLFAWKALGAGPEVSTPTWPTDRIDMRNLAPGLHSGHVGFEVPAVGQVLWRALNTSASESPQFELRAATASASPTPEASAAPGDWVGLRWGTPSVLPGPAGGHAQPGDVVSWQDGYVVVGSAQGSDGSQRAAAWLTTDGTTWSQTFTDEPGRGHSAIQFVRVVGGVLVGVGTSGVDHCTGSGVDTTCDPLPAAIWTSTDGRTWVRRAAPATPAGVIIRDVASGPAGGMMIGDTGWSHAWIWTSPDGATWTRESLPASVFAGAHLDRVVSWDAGWVVVGSVGGQAPICCDASGPIGRPAAWYSPDGTTWARASTRTPVTGSGELATLDAGSAGLVAREDPDRGAVGSTFLWTSTDGRTWTNTPWSADPWSADQQGPLRSFASDGTRILWEGWAASGPLPLFVSGDGVSWRSLDIGGATETAPLGDNSSGPQVGKALLVPHGFVAIGLRGSTGDSLIWIVRAVTAP